jgi:hypothetical protein
MPFMKKLLLSTLTLLGMMPNTYGSVEIPYYTDMATAAAVDPDWTIIDNNGDGKTWKVDTKNNNTQSSTTGATYGVMYEYSSKNNGDDWLISPAFHFEAGKTYKVKFWTKVASSGNAEDYTLYLASSADIASLKAGKVVKDYSSYKVTSWTQANETFTVDETGDYYFGFYEHSVANRYSVYISAFYVAENISYPSSVTNLTATAGADRALEATIKWTLPTTDDEGNALIGAADAVVVERNGEEIARLDGDATSFVDTAETGLTSGFHTYSVYVIYGGVSGIAKSVTTGYVGPIEPIALPYSTNFDSADDFDLWKTYDIDEDYKNSYFGWCYQKGNTSLITNYICIKNTKQGLAQDDWAVTPPLKFDRAGYYNLSFKGANNCNYYMDMTIYFGQGDKPSDLTNKIVYINQLANQVNAHSSGTACSYNFVVAEPGVYYIGFHAHGDAELTADIRIDDLSVSQGAELAQLPYSAEAVSQTANLAIPVGYIKVETSPADAAVTMVAGENETAINQGVNRNDAIADAYFKFDKAVDAVNIAVSDQTPAMADDFFVKAADGALTADITLPTKTKAGEDLFEITSASIYLNDELVADIDQTLTPGAKLKVDLGEAGDDLVSTKYELVLANLSGKSITENGYTTSVISISDAQSSMHYANATITLDRAADIVVTDISGKVIRRAASATALSLRDLSRGVYIVTANGYKPMKFIK